MTPAKKLIERAKRLLYLQRGPTISLRVMQELTEQLERYERGIEYLKSVMNESAGDTGELLAPEYEKLEAILNPQEKGE